jgi:hydroxymethylglutaryl-CoA synthase
MDHVCFHAPFGKMARKANNKSFRCESIDETLRYNSVVGNSCSASLFICFISLLDHAKSNLSGKRVGFFSYGSGSVAEFFSGIVSENHGQMLDPQNNKKMLSDRIEMTFSEYESLCYDKPDDSLCYENVGNVAMSAIENNQRIYKLLSK